MDPVTVDVNRQWQGVTWPAFSHGFNIESIKGWKPGTVSARTEFIDIEDGHGEYDMPVFRSRRTIELAGYVVADSADDLARMGDRFAGLLASGDLGRVTFDEGGLRRWANVRIHGTPSFEPTYRARADFELELRAPDPRIVGKPIRQVGTVVDVVNRGTFPATPRIQIDGNGNHTYTVTGPGGRRWVVTQDLVPEHAHVLDFETGDLIIDGNVILDGLEEADPWTCPPSKSTRITLDPGGNTAVMTISTPPTWI